MNISKCFFQALLLAAAASGASQASAQTSITLNGTVRAGTCAVANVDKTMPEVGADEFPASGGVAGSITPFELEFTGCSGVTGAALTFGTAADADSSNPNTFRNTAPNPAPHTSLWLRQGATCTSGNTITPGVAIPISISGASHTFNGCAWYARLLTGPVTSGGIGTSFIVSIVYS